MERQRRALALSLPLCVCLSAVGSVEVGRGLIARIANSRVAQYCDRGCNANFVGIVNVRSSGAFSTGMNLHISLICPALGRAMCSRHEFT